jgi:hypothetical protein
VVRTGRWWDSGHVQVKGLTIRFTRSARYQLALDNSGEPSFFFTAWNELKLIYVLQKF